MASFELKGKVIFIGAVEQVTDSFTKRTLVIETDEQYPQTVPFEFVQANTAKLDYVQQDEIVTVHFNVRGNRSKTDETKFFSNLTGWKIDKEDMAGAPAAPAPSSQPAPAATPAPAAPSGSIDDIEDDLPF